MPDNDLLEMFKQHSAGQNKYTYILLAVSASAIAFSVEKTTGMKISWSMSLLFIGVILWALSFYCGCKNLTLIQILIQSNYLLLQLQNGVHPDQPKDQQTLEYRINEVSSAIFTNINKAAIFNDWQFRFLIIGAVFFIAWHILEMILRSC